ncbi:hypothetical protein [Microcystis phage MaeS]|nr:hypothetical protein [Microcystis phage MaeS]
MQMKYLSPSRLSRFAQCQLSFRFKYIDSPSWEDQTTDWYAAYGSLVHEILEKLARKEIALWQAVATYNQEFPMCFIPEDKRPDYYSSGKAAIEQRAEDLEQLKIVGIELEFNTMIDFAVPPLHGFIDLVYEDEYGLVVRDYKSSRVYDGSLMKKQLQPHVYPLAVKELFGRYPYKFEFDFFRFNEIKSVLIDESFIQLGELKIRNYWNQIQNTEFPATYSPFFCNNFCEYRSVCPIYQLKLNR